MSAYTCKFVTNLGCSILLLLYYIKVSASIENFDIVPESIK